MNEADKKQLAENQKKAVEDLVKGLNRVQTFATNFDYSLLGNLIRSVKDLARSCGLWIGTKMNGSYDRVFVVEDFDNEETPF